MDKMQTREEIHKIAGAIKGRCLLSGKAAFLRSFDPVAGTYQFAYQTGDPFDLADEAFVKGLYTLEAVCPETAIVVDPDGYYTECELPEGHEGACQGSWGVTPGHPDEGPLGEDVSAVIMWKRGVNLEIPRPTRRIES